MFCPSFVKMHNECYCMFAPSRQEQFKNLAQFVLIFLRGSNRNEKYYFLLHSLKTIIKVFTHTYNICLFLKAMLSQCLPIKYLNETLKITLTFNRGITCYTFGVIVYQKKLLISIKMPQESDIAVYIARLDKYTQL